MIDWEKLEALIYDTEKGNEKIIETLEKESFVAKKVDSAEFKASPWEERWEMFQKLRKPLGPPYGVARDMDEKDAIPKLMVKVDLIFYNAYHAAEQRKSMLGLYKKLNKKFSTELSKLFQDKDIKLSDNSSYTNQIIELGRNLNAREEEFRNNKNLLHTEIMNLYHILLATTPHKNLGKRLLSKLEYEVSRVQKQAGTQPLTIAELAEKKDPLLLEALESVENPVWIKHDTRILLWMAKFFKNFEECYEIKYNRKFNFTDPETYKYQRQKTAAEQRIARDIGRKIERSYDKEGVMRNIKSQLERWGVGLKGGKYIYK
jgi:hypothetical protein